MSKKDEALKLALEALEKCDSALAEELAAWDIDPPLHHVLEASNACAPALAAIREAQAEMAAQQEPVAWVREHELPLAPGDAFSWVETFVHKTPLYTSPPASRPWVGLTDDERGQVYSDWRWNGSNSSNLELCQAIEAKLKEKNT